MKADLIIQSKAVFTGLKEHPEHLAVAIKDNKILAVCKPQEANKYMSDETRLIDAGEKLVSPGFFDSHIHIMAGSLFNYYAVPLSDTLSAKDAAEKVKAYADEHPDSSWIIGTGWDYTAWGTSIFPIGTSLTSIFLTGLFF